MQIKKQQDIRIPIINTYIYIYFIIFVLFLSFVFSGEPAVGRAIEQNSQ